MRDCVAAAFNAGVSGDLGPLAPLPSIPAALIRFDSGGEGRVVSGHVFVGGAGCQHGDFKRGTIGMGGREAGALRLAGTVWPRDAEAERFSKF